MLDHSEESEDIKSIIPSTDDCMDTDTMKEINFLLSGNKNMKIEETPVFNIRLIAEVKSRPFLYDQADEGYNLISWRNSAWNEIAETLETTSEHVKTRWKTLRDRYKKEEKKERLSKKQSSWVFQRPLRFIQAHLKDRHTDESEPIVAEIKSEGGNVSPLEATMNFIENEIFRNHETTPTSSSLENSSAASTSSHASAKNSHGQEPTTSSTPPPINIPMNVTPSPSATSSSGTGPSNKRARVSLTEPNIPISARSAAAAAAFSLFPGMSGAWSNREEEEDDIFGRMIALKLSKLDPRTKELAKMQVLKAIFDAQYGS